MADTLTADQARRLGLNRDLSDAKAAQVLGIPENAVRKWRAAHAKEGTMTETTTPQPASPDAAPVMEEAPATTPVSDVPVAAAADTKAAKTKRPSKARAANEAISKAAAGKKAAKSGKAEKKATTGKAAAKATAKAVKAAKSTKAKGAPRAKGSDEYGTVRTAVTAHTLTIIRAQREDIFKGKTDEFRKLLKDVAKANAEVRAPALKLAGTSDSNVKFQRRLIRRDLEARKELTVE